MRLEFVVPVLFGILLGAVGVALVFDAWTADETVIPRERRRHARIERNRNGEGLIGLGVIGMAAAFIGRDAWSGRTISVILGSVLLLWGAWKNKHFLGAWMRNRGAMRRRHQPGAGSLADLEIPVHPVTAADQAPAAPPLPKPPAGPADAGPEAPPTSDKPPRLRIR